MTRDAIQPYIDARQPVTLTVKRTRTISDEITTTLDHIDGRCVVGTDGRYYRTSAIKAIVPVTYIYIDVPVNGATT